MSVPDTIEEAGGEVRWIQRPDGTRLRSALFAQKGEAGWCLLLPGYTEFMEKHLETVGDLRARGFGVLSLDWRGQGLSDRALADRHKGHIEEFEQHLEDLDAVVADAGILSDGPITLLGHSMGGHLAVRFMQRRQDDVARAVIIAPMMGVTRLGPAGGLLVRALCLMGLGERYVFGGQPYGERNRTFKGNRLTSDPGRFARAPRLIAARPDLALADPTFGWVDAAWRSIALTRRPGWLEAVKTPMLVAIAGREQIVDNPSTEAAVARLPNATAIRFEVAEHEILGETDAIRAELWSAIDDFLGTAQGVQR